MSFNIDIATEMGEHGLMVGPEDSLVWVGGGSISPMGYQAPTGSRYFQNNGNIWRKSGAGINDWIVEHGPEVSGVTPPFLFSRGGNLPTGTWFKIGDVVSSQTGQPIAGNNKIVKISLTNYNTVLNTTRVQIARRTSRTTWEDVSGAYIDILANGYKADRSGMSVVLPTNAELGAYVDTGSALKDAVMEVYLIPA